jgi:hypothetical protein
MRPRGSVLSPIFCARSGVIESPEKVWIKKTYANAVLKS